MILHVCCKDINAANKLWKMAHSVGYKRGGIRKGRHWYNVEIMGSEFIEAPLKRVSKEYIRILVKEGNKRMKRSFSRMKKFERKLTN
jgi:tRNA(Phe) wybutosine-synthesizing methylase Tyw3